MTVVDAIGVQPATTFGARARVPRPVLLILVYGIFLVIVGLTAVAQTAMVSADLSATTLNTTVGADAALVRLFVTSNLSPDDLGPAGPTPERQATLEGRLASLVRPGEILRVEVRRPDGRILAADDPAARGLDRRAVGRLHDRARRPDRDGRDRRRAAERGGRDAARDERRGPRILPADHRRAGPRRGRRVARRGADPGDPRCGPLERRPRDAVGRAHRRDRPVSRVPLGPGPDHPPDGGARRCAGSRHADRDAQPRGTRRPRGDGHRARPRDRRGDRRRADRHRQLPVAQRDVWPRRRQRGAPDRRRRPAPIAARRRRLRTLRAGRIPRWSRRPARSTS